MEKKLERKYGLFTAICMVVGTVIGSGVFFKAQTVLEKTGGNMTLGILSWIITGMLMIICSAMFAVMATKYEKVSGVVDYAEAACGPAYGYYLAWFLVNIYYPAMTGVLAWVSARYFGEILGWGAADPEVMTLASLFLIGNYALNAFSPQAGRQIPGQLHYYQVDPHLPDGNCGCYCRLCKRHSAPKLCHRY